MKKTIISVVVLASASFYIAGCGQSSETKAALNELHKKRADKDVTSSPEYNFSSFAGSVWKTKVKVAIIDSKNYKNEHYLGLISPDAFDSTDPKYNPVDDLKIISILPVGTSLRIERLMQDNGVWGGIWVEATLADGTNSQRTVQINHRLLVKNCFIWSKLDSLSTNWGMNPDMLEVVKTF